MHNYADQINWEDFHFALAIAHGGSFIKAAKAMGVHHTTVARRLERLESTLTTQLFHRHTRGVELTTAGQEILTVMSRMQEDIQSLSARLQGYNNELTGKLRITTLAPFLNFLAPYLHTFQERYPSIDFEIILEDRGLSLAQGEADIALRAGSMGTEDMVVPIHLAEIRFALYGSINYFTKHTVPESIEDLKTHKYIMLKNPPSSFVWTRWLQKELKSPQAGITLNHPSGIPSAVQAGFGLGFLICSEGEKNPNLRLAWANQSSWKNDFWLLVHRDRYRSAKIQAFIQFVKTEVQSDLQAYLNWVAP